MVENGAINRTLLRCSCTL